MTTIIVDQEEGLICVDKLVTYTNENTSQTYQRLESKVDLLPEGQLQVYCGNLDIAQGYPEIPPVRDFERDTYCVKTDGGWVEIYNLCKSKTAGALFPRYELYWELYERGNVSVENNKIFYCVGSGSKLVHAAHLSGRLR